VSRGYSFSNQRLARRTLYSGSPRTRLCGPERAQMGLQRVDPSGHDGIPRGVVGAPGAAGALAWSRVGKAGLIPGGQSRCAGCVSRRGRPSLAPGGEPACKPGSVEGNHSSGIHVAVDLKRPTRKRARICAVESTFYGCPAASLFGLAPGGVYRAVSVARAAVRSYRTVSPLPSSAE